MSPATLRQVEHAVGIGGPPEGMKPDARREAARFHHASRRWGGGVAARGVRAAAGEAADHRALGREAVLNGKCCEAALADGMIVDAGVVRLCCL
jgi:hypothetical protein